nr:hypothetical protein [Streptomyces sp. NBC_00557]
MAEAAEQPGRRLRGRLPPGQQAHGQRGKRPQGAAVGRLGPGAHQATGRAADRPHRHPARGGVLTRRPNTRHGRRGPHHPALGRLRPDASGRPRAAVDRPHRVRQLAGVQPRRTVAGQRER